MVDEQLKELLGKVGMNCFVTYFEVFSDQHLRNIDVAERIQREPPRYTLNSCNTRTSKARSIINAGRAKDALTLVANSKHWSITSGIRARALTLAEGLC